MYCTFCIDAAQTSINIKAEKSNNKYMFVTL